MQRFNRAERQIRIERVREVAMRLVELEGYIDQNGELVPFSSFHHNELSIDVLSPRSGSALPRKLTIRYFNKMVFFLEWDDDQQYRSTYKPGEWGPIMLQCFRRQRQAELTE